MPGVAFPPVGRLGLTSPRSSVLCSAKTAPLSFSGRFACRSLPDTLSAPSVCVPNGSLVGGSSPHARALGQPVPLLFRRRTRRPVALPSSRVPPLTTMPRSQTPVVSYPLAIRGRDCCLPLVPPRRLSPQLALRSYPMDHNYTHFGAPLRGLSPRYPRLRTPLTGLHAGSLLTCWLGVGQVGLESRTLTHWETITYFIDFSSTP